jgi:excisionase family DNA binding protein
MRDAARNPSGGAGLTAGIGAGIGIGNLMGQALQGGMANTMQGGQQQQPQQPQGGGGAAPAVMSPAEAANYLKVAESDVMSMITDGTLKSKKIGTQIRISKQALDDFLNS